MTHLDMRGVFLRLPKDLVYYEILNVVPHLAFGLNRKVFVDEVDYGLLADWIVDVVDVEMLREWVMMGFEELVCLLLKGTRYGVLVSSLCCNYAASGNVRMLKQLFCKVDDARAVQKIFHFGLKYGHVDVCRYMLGCMDGFVYDGAIPTAFKVSDAYFDFVMEMVRNEQASWHNTATSFWISKAVEFNRSDVLIEIGDITNAITEAIKQHNCEMVKVLMDRLDFEDDHSCLYKWFPIFCSTCSVSFLEQYIRYVPEDNKLLICKCLRCAEVSNNHLVVDYLKAYFGDIDTSQCGNKPIVSSLIKIRGVDIDETYINSVFHMSHIPGFVVSYYIINQKLERLKQEKNLHFNSIMATDIFLKEYNAELLKNNNIILKPHQIRYACRSTLLFANKSIFEYYMNRGYFNMVPMENLAMYRWTAYCLGFTYAYDILTTIYN